MNRFLLLLVATILFSRHGTAQHKYYFSVDGRSEGNGTIQQPFRSLQELSELNLQPGDSILFAAGEKFTGNILLHDIHGTNDQKIIFASYPEKCLINGGNKEAFFISRSSYFEIVNLACAGAGRKTGSTTEGVKLVNCNNVVLNDLDISGFQKSGLLLYNCQHVEVNSVFAHENGLAGILVEGDYQKRLSTNIHIVNCVAENNPGDPTNLTNHSGNGILAGNCKNVLIEYCTATNNGWDMPRIGNGPVGIWAYEADSVMIQHCISYRNKTAKGAADGGGFDLDGGVTNSVIQYCLSYENWGSGYGIYQYWSASKWTNNTVRYCISINDGYVTDEASAMLIWNGNNGDSMFTNFYAYNNFFYNEKKYAFGFSDLCRHKKFHFLNNVFVASNSSDIYNGTDSSTDDIFMGNVWMRKSGGFAQTGFSDLSKWSERTGYERYNGKMVGASFQEQLFNLPSKIDITDPYSLQKDSPLLFFCNDALKEGIDIKKMFGIDKGKADFFGHTIMRDDSNERGVCEMP